MCPNREEPYLPKTEGQGILSSLGIFLKHRLLPRKLVYHSWYQDDVDIVERLLIPVENKIARSLGVSELNRQTDPLYYVTSVKHKFQKMVK